MSDNVGPWNEVNGNQTRRLEIEFRDSLNRGQPIILNKTCREMLIGLCKHCKENARFLNIASTDGVAEILKGRVRGEEVRGIGHFENCVVNRPWELVQGVLARKVKDSIEPINHV